MSYRCSESHDSTSVLKALPGKHDITRFASFDIKLARFDFENACQLAWQSLAMSTRDLEALPVKLDIKRHTPCILYIYVSNKIFV